MAQPYIGEIRLFAGNYAPSGWHFCDGSLLSISDNETLFQLIGTTYGGDGQVSFAVPDLRGRTPVHFGSNAGTSFVPGQRAGVEQVILTSDQMPAHTHDLLATTAIGTQRVAKGNLVSQSPQVILYYEGPPDTNMAGGAVGLTGGSKAHDNMAPFQCINYIISLFGLFPSQS